MRYKQVFLIVSLMLLSMLSILGAEQVIVEGKPPITMRAADCHMRLIEFVLETRMTVAQKNAFLDAIKSECTQMSEEDRQGFLSALELAESMEQMEAAGHDAVKFVLKKDFEETATSLPGDPAANLYRQLKNKIVEPMVKVQENVITSQSFAALVEYLQFIASPHKPIEFSEASKAELKKVLEEYYLKLDENEQALLDQFELTWYMIRAGWQNISDKQKKNSAEKEMQKTNLKPGQSLDLKKLKDCFSPEIYGDLIDEAAKLGFEPNEWSVGQKLTVW